MQVTTCKTCSNGYYLLNNQCLKGDIINCDQYQNQDTCIKCSDGHVLMNLKNLVICLKINQAFNCIQWN